VDFFLDRNSDVPIRRQIRGTIEYAIACGGLEIGEALPSVRELADQLGVAPMTISQIYGDLKRDGLVEARTGAGTFVADSTRAQMAARTEVERLHREIDALIDNAQALGIGFHETGALINARLAYRAAVGRRCSVVMAGLFPEATRAYARSIASQLGGSATVLPATVDLIQHDAGLKARVSASDLIVTFPTLRPQLAAIFPNTQVVAIRFIPAEATRLALASLDPMARVLVISKFAEFLPILRLGVTRFAAHCQNVTAFNEGDPELPDRLADSEVLIFATGAEKVLERAPAGVQAVEYRHIPDPGDIDRVVKPFVEALIGPTPAQRKDAS